MMNPRVRQQYVGDLTASKPEGPSKSLSVEGFQGYVISRGYGDHASQAVK